MKLIGLTGGVGMGKSTAAEFLQRQGLPVACTDVIARDIVEPGQPALVEIQRAFGGEILGSDGRLLRDRLARIVFADEAKRRELEAILHPRIRQQWHWQAEAWRVGSVPAGVVAIPLLFETQAEVEFDCVICVACSPPTQRQRLQPRGWSLKEIERRNQAQWPLDRKMAAAHFVVWNEGGLDVHAGQIERILAHVLPRR